MALLYLGNHILTFMGKIIGIEELTFLFKIFICVLNCFLKKILSYVLLSFTYIIGLSDAKDSDVRTNFLMLNFY